jgi:ABC-type Fe3+-hydroxamate transport system substrate-binding protein
VENDWIKLSQNNLKQSIDQLGREVSFPYPPKRIISLVPSQTELLFDLGLAESVIGVTLFCIHPEEAKNKEKVGGTKKLKLEKIAFLHPDLIIANKEENTKEQIEWLSERFPVWISDIKNLDDSFAMIRGVGEITNTTERAEFIISRIINSFEDIKPVNRISTLYLIWREPWMSVGSETFIHHILEKCGLENVVKNELRYPELTNDTIKELNPQLVLLSSEPYPFKEKHIAGLKTILPEAEVRLADGEMFSWYGSRLIKTGKYLKKFLASLS